MDGSQICLLIVLLILVAFSALLSSTETAYSSASMIRLKQMAKDRGKCARTVYSISKNFMAAITAILVGNNAVNILATPIATELFIQMFENIGAVVIIGVVTILILTSGEITPRIVAKARAESVVLSMIKPLPIIVPLLRPISFAVEPIETH